MKTFITQSKYKKIFIIVFWLFIWEMAALMINRDVYLPTPFSTMKALYYILFNKQSYITILYSTYRTIFGFLLSCFFGVILGYFCGINNFVYDLFKPFISIIRTIPIMSIIIIALFWFRGSNVPVFVTFLMCFPIIWTSTVSGIHNTDKGLLEMCKIYNIKNSRILKSIYSYSSLPYLKSGMLSSLGISWKVTSAAEVLSLPKYAIGSQLYDSKVYLDIPSLFAWTIIIIVLSFLFENILSMLFNKTSY